MRICPKCDEVMRLAKNGSGLDPVDFYKCLSCGCEIFFGRFTIHISILRQFDDGFKKSFWCKCCKKLVSMELPAPSRQCPECRNSLIPPYGNDDFDKIEELYKDIIMPSYETRSVTFFCPTCNHRTSGIPDEKDSEKRICPVCNSAKEALQPTSKAAHSNLVNKTCC